MLVSFAAAANAGCASDADGSGNEQPLPIKPVTVMDRTVSCKGAPLTIVSGLDGVLFRTAWSRTGTAGELCKGSTNASDCQKSVASRLSEQKTLAGVGTRGETLVDVMVLSEAFGVIDSDAKAIALVQALYPGGGNINPVQIACDGSNISGDAATSYKVRGYESACSGRVTEVIYTVTKDGVVTAGTPRELRPISGGAMCAD